MDGERAGIWCDSILCPGRVTDAMKPLAATFSLAEVTAVLSRTPATLRGLLSGLPDSWVLATEGEDTFSPRDVLGHLIHGEQTDWMPRIRLILESGTSEPFAPFDRFGFRTAAGDRSGAELLDEFDSLRTANLQGLEAWSLGPEQFALEGRHPALGSVTLSQLLATWAVHDLNHIGQIVRVMSRRYTETVGPWREYLGILNR